MKHIHVTLNQACAEDHFSTPNILILYLYLHVAVHLNILQRVIFAEVIYPGVSTCQKCIARFCRILQFDPDGTKQLKFYTLWVFPDDPLCLFDDFLCVDSMYNPSVLDYYPFPPVTIVLIVSLKWVAQWRWSLQVHTQRMTIGIIYD